MTSSSPPQPPRDEAPIDAEFEPADPPSKDAKGAGKGAGRFALLLVAISAFLALFLGAAVAGYVPGFKPGQSELNALKAELERLQESVASDLAETQTQTSEIAALQSRADSLTADRTRALSDLRAIRDEIETLQADVSTLQRARVASLADPDDANEDGAESPDLDALNTRVSALEDALVAQLGTYDTTLEALRSRIDDLEAQTEAAQRNANRATNARTEAAFALSAIEAAARRGRPFLSAHQKLSEALPENEAVERLAPLANEAIPTVSDLRTAYPALMTEALDQSARASGTGPSWMRGLFGDGIQVRREGETTPRDHLNQAMAALERGDVSDAIEHVQTAGPDLQPVFTDWLDNARNRDTLEQTLEALRLTMIAEERP